MTPFKLATTSAICGALTALVAVTAFAQANATIANFKFPDSISATKGAPITWTNNDSAPHQVVIASKNLKTAVLNKGQSGALTLADAGSYDYVCGIHGSMKGKIVVK